MAAVGIGSTLFGGVLGAQGAQQQAQAQSQAELFKAAEAQFQAGIALQNKQISEQNASYAKFAGEVEAQQASIQSRQEIGQTRAQQGAGNLDINSGSNVQVRMSMAGVGEENVAMIRSNAAKAAYGDTVQAIQFGEQADWQKTAASFDTQAAGYAMTAGDINATSSILGSVGKAASMGAGAYKTGVV